MADPLRIGVAGFGRLARDYYLPAFRTLPGARLVAVADPLFPSRADAARRMPSVAVFPDHAEMLERVELNALLVSSPPSTHLPIWNAAAARDLPVFMEKPFVLCGELPQIERGRATAKLMLDFNRRFWPTYRRIGELIQRGDLGKPVQLDFLLHTDVLSWSTVTRHRFSSDEGGILHDLGGHAIDLAAILLGQEPESVTARISDARRSGDQLLLELAFADGSMARCDLAWGDRTRERLAVAGPRGRLSLADPNMAIRLARNGTHGLRISDDLRDLAIFGYRVLRRDRTMSRFSIRSALAAFVRSISDGEPFSPGFEDAVRNVRWLEAAARSAAEGKPAPRPV
jgi:predicted dehydrogenase